MYIKLIIGPMYKTTTRRVRREDRSFNALYFHDLIFLQSASTFVGYTSPASAVSLKPHSQTL